MAEKIRVIVTGALGKMGKEATRAILGDDNLELVGLIDVKSRGDSIREFDGAREVEIQVQTDLEELLDRAQPDVMLDFTNPQAVFNNAKTALNCKINCVVGTTGLNDMELKQLEKIAQQNRKAIAVIPNFAIGAVLMMKLAGEVAQYFSEVEIIEMHHNQKLDAPSGTSIKTAEIIAAHRNDRPSPNNREVEKVAGCRGGGLGGIRIHSVRLPGLIAHQEVIFGGTGQSLTIRHDSFDRASFMPGVLMAIKKISARNGLVYGLEHFL